jgi:hypothetical protein
MKHKNEAPIEHLKECLDIAEKTEDPDFYFLTVDCGTKLYGIEILEKIVKEAIYMSSGLYRQPYETGKIEGKTDLLIRQLSKRFGFLPVDIREKINQADQYQLDLIVESIFDFKSADDMLKYLQ